MREMEEKKVDVWLARLERTGRLLPFRVGQWGIMARNEDLLLMPTPEGYVLVLRLTDFATRARQIIRLNVPEAMISLARICLTAQELTNKSYAMALLESLRFSDRNGSVDLLHGVPTRIVSFQHQDFDGRTVERLGFASQMKDTIILPHPDMRWVTVRRYSKSTGCRETGIKTGLPSGVYRVTTILLALQENVNSYFGVITKAMDQNIIEGARPDFSRVAVTVGGT